MNPVAQYALYKLLMLYANKIIMFHLPTKDQFNNNTKKKQFRVYFNF